MTRQPPLDPAVAATRLAVRGFLAGRPGAVLVALSGGADSLALAAAVAFEAPKAGVRAGAVVIDHDMQQGSAQVAERAAQQARSLGLDPVIVRRVRVDARGDGPEAAAREARYAALESARVDAGAERVLTAHTRDDQAEQVLLALGRGSGTRAIAGIPPRRGAIVRPFLGLSREQTRAACLAQRLDAWIDPHNSDPRFTRARVRERVLPALAAELGPGIAVNLARTAELAREDADALDAIAEAELERILVDDSLLIVALESMPEAVRQRVIRLAAQRLGAGWLSRQHTLAIAELVTAWRGQGPIDVPGLTASRASGVLRLARR